MLMMLLWPVVVVLGWLIYIKRPSGVFVKNSTTFLGCLGGDMF